MDIKALIKKGGGASELARRLGPGKSGRVLTPEAVRLWGERGAVPAHWVLKFAAAVEVPPHEVSPTLYPAPSTSEASTV